jgi:hypothetical protein
MTKNAQKILIALGIVGGAAAVVGVTYAVMKSREQTAGGGGYGQKDLPPADKPQGQGNPVVGPVYDVSTSSGNLYTATGIDPKTGKRIEGPPPPLDQETGTYA